MSWSEYIDLVEKANSYRNRVKPKRLKSDMGKYGVGTSVGSKRAQAGSPYKNVKVSFKGKGFNDISAPPGALEEADETSFALHQDLQPDIWEGDELNEEVRQRLVEIACDFITTLQEAKDLGAPIEVQDIRFTGSLANYNWSKYSDIDLHILVDFSQVNEDIKLVKAFFDEARMRWNDQHRIMIHGFEVEIYVEDINENHKSSGVYSLFGESWSAGERVGEFWSDWLVKPDPHDTTIDFATANKKADDYKERTECISNLIIDAHDHQLALSCIERVKEKIRDMRKAGLESPEAEFSAENIAFKILRRDGVLGRLNELKKIAYDEMMSIKEE